MFLKKLKINGFKSFAKPIVIHFESPLTTIVGPNGSGKSNIVDAFRWALGEQSAKSLRGSRMSDVIFAGSDDYKPLHKASVTLYLDNSEGILAIDAAEIRICRRVNESGQSDYLLNGNPCRLKDIEELLMDTGMGKDSYSIVGQGKIDSILNSKPEVLRELIEEAAGISKHKMRKEEAEGRLGKTRLNLQRVQDLIWELNNQFEPLEKAADKARKHLHLKDELEVLEVSMLLDRWGKTDQGLKQAKEDKSTMESKITLTVMEMENTRQESKDGQQAIEKQQDELEQLQGDYYKLKTKKEETQNNLKVLEERNNSLIREKSRLEEQLLVELATENRLQKKNVELEKEITATCNEEQAIEEKLTEKSNLLVGKRRLLQENKEKLFLRRNSVMGENVELTDLQAELEKVKSQNKYLELEIDRLLKNKNQIVEQLNDKFSQQEKLQQDLDNTVQKIEILSQEKTKLQAKKCNLGLKIEEMGTEIADYTSKINKNKSHLSALIEMENDYQGYFQGVKSILKKQDMMPGVIGVVADLIKVEKKYELAIETALGNRLQNIVVDEDTTAQKCIKYLKEIDGGRASFLPLNLVRGNRARVNKMNISELEGYLGLAADFVEYQEGLELVANNLLGKTIIAANLEQGINIARKINSSLKIVTLDGDVINPGGAITGGSRGSNKNSLLGRTREIKELQLVITEMEEKLPLVERKKHESQELRDETILLIEENRENSNQLTYKLNDLRKDHNNLLTEQQKREEELEKINEDFMEYHSKLAANDEEIDTLEQKIDLINNEYFKEKDEIEKMEEEINILDIQEEAINNEITELKVVLATAKQKKENLHQEKNSVQQQASTNKQKLKETKQSIAQLEENIVSLEKRANELQTMRQSLTAETERLSKLQDEKNKLYKIKQKELEQLREKLQELQEKSSSLKEKDHQLDLKLTRFEDRILQIEDKLREEYELEPGTDYPDKIEIDSYKQVRQKISEFKRAIKNLEPVNPGAIQEYDELKNRLDYLTEQRDDLLEAEEAIQKIIAEIEKTISRQFYKTFVEVKEHFEHIFRKLFNGGKAELSLTSTTNLLETGIEIQAQPPGKQLKKLSLMSGGERALTAIALVFAFLQVNPSPIYILDEIDAPLDDANVVRFARFIKEYSHYVQFLLITHNKNMMVEANIIYGITMEEPGISKLISLKLDDEIVQGVG